MVACWGTDNPSDAADGKPFAYASLVPVVIDGVNSLVKVANGRSFACGIKKDSRINCWGSNLMNQLGTNQPWKAKDGLGGIGVVQGISGATDLSASTFRSCAIKNNEVWCWGGVEIPMEWVYYLIK